MNDPGYYAALRDENDTADDALAAIRLEESAGRITTGEAAAERCALLTQHLDRLARLRATYAGGAE